MAYNLKRAREAGLSDSEIIEYLSKDRSYNIDGAREAGLTEAQIAEYMSTMSVSPRKTSPQP